MPVPTRRSFGGTLHPAFARGQARGMAITGGKAVMRRLKSAGTVGQNATSAFDRPPLRRSTFIGAGAQIRKPLGETVSRPQAGERGLPGAQTRVTTLQGGVRNHTPTKLL